jgi:hypothetical protein
LDKTVKIWDERNGFVKNYQLQQNSLPWAIKTNNDETEFLVGYENGVVELFDIRI